MTMDLTKSGFGDSRHPYLPEGMHLLKVDNCILKKTRQKGLSFIVEFEMLSSNNLADPANPMTKGGRIGSHYSWFQKLEIDAGPGAVNAFLLALAGLRRESPEVTAFVGSLNAIFQAVTDMRNGARGMVVGVECKIGPLKSGADFTFHNYFPAPECGQYAKLLEQVARPAASRPEPPAGLAVNDYSVPAGATWPPGQPAPPGYYVHPTAGTLHKWP